MKFLTGLIFVVIYLFAFSEAMVNSAPSEHMPYYAYVEFRNQQSQGFFGGGVFISSMHVLTSGSNVHGSNAWLIAFGTNRRSTQRTVVSQRGVAHPGYSLNNNFHSNDIGVIFLPEAIVFNSNVFPIFMNWKEDVQIGDVNIQGMILGFAGANPVAGENLQAAHVRVIDDGLCRQVFPNFNPNEQFCAVDEERSNICLGDQGGPLTVVSRGVEILIGIGSTPRCAQGPSTYTRIEPYQDWIREQTQMMLF